MTSYEIACHRLGNQLIGHSDAATPEETVLHMVALQAQDYYSSLWAIGLRTSSTVTEAEIEQAVANKKIVRTWPMRGTLHFTAAEDARWMLKLLTPRIIKSSAGRHKQLGLDKSVFSKSRQLIEKHLQGENALTRSELYGVLEKNGISTEGQRGYHIIWYLAQTAVICFGSRHGKQHTFVLFDEWITKNKNLEGGEALAELASRYIKSRGPVTEYDFANWAGLTVTTAREALIMTESKFEKTEIDGQTYWFPELNGLSNYNSSTHLLPGFDEMICGYKDRSAVLESDRQKSVILKNGILKPIIVSEGKVIGSWKRSLKKDKVIINPEPFNKLTKIQEKNIAVRGTEYANFLELGAVFEFGN